MGLIAQRIAAAAGETRWGASNFLDDDHEELGTLSTAGVRVTRSAALGLSTIWRCVDLLASSVAHSPKDIIVKVGGQSFPEYSNLPGWLTMPNPADPTYTSDDHFKQVAISVLLAGEFIVAALPSIFDPLGLLVLDPARVDVRPGPYYDIKDDRGQVIRTLNAYQVLHGKWMSLPGSLRGISPLEALRRGIGSAIAAEDFAGRFFGQGAALSFGVEVPYAMDKTKLNDLRDSMRAKYVGLRNSHAIGVLSDGGKFVTGLAPTPEQAQMLATRKFSVEDLCRPYGVPPSLVGSQEPGASSYASSATHDMQFKERAVLPLANLIERQYNRLVSVPATITDPNASAQFRFNLDAIARVDVLTRAQAYREFVFAGVMQPAEARVKEDLPPVKGADQLFMQVQMTPIDLLGKTPPPPPPPEPTRSEVVLHNHLAPPAATNVTIAEGAFRADVSAPTSFADGAIRSETPITFAEGAIRTEAPVTVNTPAVTVAVPEPAPTPASVRKHVERDGEGRITAIVEELA